MTEEGEGGIRQLAPGHFPLFWIRIGGKDVAPFNQEGRTAFLILVNSQKIRMLHQRTVFRRQGTQIRTHHQRHARQAPEAELKAVFLIGAHPAQSDVALAAHAHGEHIHVVEATGAAHAEMIELGLEDIREGNIVIHDIPRRAVHMRTAAAHPLPGILLAPVAGGEENLPSVAGRIGGAGHNSGAGIHTELEPF